MPSPSVILSAGVCFCFFFASVARARTQRRPETGPRLPGLGPRRVDREETLALLLRDGQPGHLRRPRARLRAAGLPQLRLGRGEAQEDGGAAAERAVPAPGATREACARGDGPGQGGLLSRELFSRGAPYGITVKCIHSGSVQPCSPELASTMLLPEMPFVRP